MIFTKLEKFQDVDILILRIGIGVAFLFHGVPKLIAGPEMWTNLGGALGSLGFDFAPTTMGFLAALSESLGGLLLALGLFTPIASLFLFFTMLVATLMHISNGEPFMKYSHAFEAAILFLSLIFIGAGKFSLDNMFCKKNSS